MHLFVCFVGVFCLALKWLSFVTSNLCYGMAGPGAAEARSGQTRWGRGCSPNCSELWLPLPCSFCFSSFPLHLLPPCWVSSAFFIFLFFIFLFIFLPVLRCTGVSLSVPLLCPVLLGARQLLPTSLGQQLQTGRRTEAPWAWNTLLQLLFSYWTCLCFMMMFLWQSTPWFREGEKGGIWRPLERTGSALAETHGKPNFPLPSPICLVYQLTSSIHV